MKKILFFSLLMTIGLLVSSCSSCSKKQSNSEEKAPLVVENLISADREYMYNTYNENYRWYETTIVLNDTIDSENCDGSFKEVENLFQYIDEEGQPNVVKIIHTADTTVYETIKSFVIEDSRLNDEPIKLTYADAWQRLVESNAVRPHSVYCVLRKALLPGIEYPQYIFGNEAAQITVDAFTGDVTSYVAPVPDYDPEDEDTEANQ